MVRSLIVVALGLAWGLAPAGAEGETRREQSLRSFEAEGLEGVRIENARGRVTLRRGRTAAVEVSALKLVHSADPGEAERFARGTRVVAEREEDRLHIRVRYPQRQKVKVGLWDLVSGYELPRVEVRLEVAVPDGLSVHLSSSTGDLRSEDLRGAQTLETSSGDVEIVEAGGPLVVRSVSGSIVAAGVGSSELRSASGEVRVTEARGPLRVGTGSGAIRVEAAEDSVSLVSASGDIEVERARRGLEARSSSGSIVARRVRGEVLLESASGDVQVGLSAPLRRAEVATASGSVRAWLDPAVGCDLRMRTGSGTLDVSVPIEVKSVTRRQVVGVIGDGRAPVRLTTSSGDVVLASGENP